MQIIDLNKADIKIHQAAAAILVEAFRETAPGSWPDLESGMAEVLECLGPELIIRGAINDRGELLGWIGGNSQYDGNVWELHPLVVRPDQQGTGIGGALVRDFEEQVRARGGITITLGTDDETGATSLSGIDLYPNVCVHLAEIRNLRRHPFEFYQKMGYVITGVIPDANGPGKPDILMCKRVL